MRKILLLVLLIGVVAAGWSALWFYAAREAGVRFDGWLASEDTQGRSWTCPERKIGGYPAALTITCAKPTYSGHTPTGTESGTAKSLLVEAAVTHPTSLALTLGAPLTYKSADGTADIKANWSSLTIDLEGLTDTKTVAVHGKDVAVDNLSGEERQGGKATTLDATFDLTQPRIGFDIAIGGTTMPVLDGLLGGEAPVEAALAGRLDRKDVGGSATLPDAIERWRQQGGQVTLESSRVARADASVTGSGTLGLDDAHRLQGRLDASFVGLEPVLKRFGISGNLAAAGSLLSTLFGGGPPKAQAAPGSLNLPISFQNGRLGIGPIRTLIALPPLY